MRYTETSTRDDDARDGGDPREWGAAAHVAVWSAPRVNRFATIAAAYCAASLLPWLLLWGFGRRAEAPMALLVGMLPLPLVGAAVSALAYSKAQPPAFAGRGASATTLFVHGIHLAFLVLAVAWSGASEPANRLTCASHLRRIGQSLTFYAVKYDTRYPPTLDLLILHADTPASAFICESTGDETATGPSLDEVIQSFRTDPRRNSYAYAGGGLTADAVTRDHVLAYEHLPNHNHAGMNVLYGDGNVRWIERAEAEHLIAELGAGHNPPLP
jgi:prepilin-type processing-associated H-X9-DG protein